MKPEHGIKGFLHSAADVFEGRMMCVHWRIQAAVGIGRQTVFLLTVVTLVLIWGAEDISELSDGVHCAGESSCLNLVFVSFYGPFLKLYVLGRKVLFYLGLSFYSGIHPKRAARDFLNLKSLNVSGWF